MLSIGWCDGSALFRCRLGQSCTYGLVLGCIREGKYPCCGLRCGGGDFNLHREIRLKICPFFFAFFGLSNSSDLLSGVRRFPNFQTISWAVRRRMSGSFASEACLLTIVPRAYHGVVESIQSENNRGIELFLPDFDLQEDIPTFR